MLPGPRGGEAGRAFLAGRGHRRVCAPAGAGLGDALKQQIVVENRPGASGNIGAEVAAKAAPDGYTFLVSANPALTVNPSLYRNLAYNAERDFVPITRGVIAPMVICVHSSVPARTLAELVAIGKREPGKLSFGSAGTGSPTYLGIRMLEEVTGAKFLHVPYKAWGRPTRTCSAGSSSSCSPMWHRRSAYPFRKGRCARGHRADRPASGHAYAG